MRELHYEGTRWISSMDGGWKSGKHLPTETARALILAYKKGKVRTVRHLLAKEGFHFSGEIIRLACDKTDDPDVRIVYLHVSVVCKMSKIDL